jgi:tight adherence protein B
MMFAILAICVFLLVAVSGYVLATTMRTRQESERLLGRRLDRTAGPPPKGASHVLKDRRLSSIGVLDFLLTRVGFVPALARAIRQAGLRRRAGEVLLYVPLLACTGFLFTLVLSHRPLVGLAVAAILGSLPLLLVYRMKRTRALQFAEQLPDALDLIRAALQAGHGFGTALAVVANEFPNPIAEEFNEVAEEMRLGLSLREALNGLNDRIDDPDLPMLIIGVLIADESGGNLAEVLENIGHTVRERFKMSRDIRVYTAQGRLSGSVLTALPFLVGLVMYYLNPAYFRPMLATSLGNWMLIYAFVSIVIGHFIVRHLVSFRA